LANRNNLAQNMGVGRAGLKKETGIRPSHLRVVKKIPLVNPNEGVEIAIEIGDAESRDGVKKEGVKP